MLSRAVQKKRARRVLLRARHPEKYVLQVTSGVIPTRLPGIPRHQRVISKQSFLKASQSASFLITKYIPKNPFFYVSTKKEFSENLYTVRYSKPLRKPFRNTNCYDLKSSDSNVKSTNSPKTAHTLFRSRKCRKVVH
jgi:hypothetical protein